ncbi:MULTISPECIES: superinfection immunity protein [Acidithiobacillus]|jgi:hypothetical protein|uniref:Superinfection immunity protein n=3 Tax=Acidithiobacillus caldus TaxID=33059 RepID=F9ZKY7_ACICS|nr:MULTISPECIES: superinfection immunity protein [Acidithiobacillus]AEK57514.1 conserved hypothetical protein [Acidithiobacillus caldus SM-1]AIA54725.1 hypothetical protein Acaty_c0848 [Acidithiobacillus caldus ATCC 51756]AUW32223.1 superinfection immunity protein [Acidithiobacillus caldus]MBU2731071.1 superinfection immunity protein [Acidithiobacillus caldus]MBU2735054.1 superinfection immunity protein [Acidithiobacillus caldus ATCC 51756]
MIHWLFYSPQGFDVLLLLGTGLGIVIYLLPSLLSWAAGSPRSGLIAMNVLLGWTLVFWLVAFIWAIRLWANGPSEPESERHTDRRREPRLG